MNDDRVFQTGAKRDNADGKGRMDLLPWNAIIELSKHCERGAKHYGENNVRKGIPFNSLADSGARHLAKWIAGIEDEPTHLVAACWNLMWLLEETITRPELNDMPWGEDEAFEMEQKKRELIKAAKDLPKYELVLNESAIEYLKSSEWLDREHTEHPDDIADREKKIAESGES